MRNLKIIHISSLFSYQGQNTELDEGAAFLAPAQNFTIQDAVHTGGQRLQKARAQSSVNYRKKILIVQENTDILKDKSDRENFL